MVTNAYGQLHNHRGATFDSGRRRLNEELVQVRGQVGGHLGNQPCAVVSRRCRVELVLQPVQRRHPPVDHLGRQRIKLLLAVHGVRIASDVELNLLELAAKGGIQVWVEALVEDLVHYPLGDDSSTHRSHLLLTRLEGVGADNFLQPLGQASPVLADVERQVVDGAVQSVEPVDVLVVVEGGPRLRHALVGDGILQMLNLAIKLFDLGLAIKVEALYVLILCDCKNEQR
nr:hypothetical protein [Trichoderma harzianum]